MSFIYHRGHAIVGDDVDQAFLCTRETFSDSHLHKPRASSKVKKND